MNADILCSIIKVTSVIIITTATVIIRKPKETGYFLILINWEVVMNRVIRFHFSIKVSELRTGVSKKLGNLNSR